MKIAVTGANGFIGGHAVRHFARLEHEVNAIVRSQTRSPAQWSALSTLKVSAIGDKAHPSPRLFDDILDGADVVIHLAGLAAAPRTDNAEAALKTANVELTADLVAAAKRTGVRRFIHLSSIRTVVGSSSDNGINDETLPKPLEPYGRSKLESEVEVRKFSESGRFCISLRPPLVFGADAANNWMRLQKLAAGNLPLPFAGINNRRSYLCVDTLCEALVHLAVHDWPAAHSGAYCLADRHPQTIAEVIAALRRGMGKSPRLFHLPGLPASRSLPVVGGIAESLFGSLEIDSERFFQTFGFEPVTPVAEAMENAGAQYWDQR